MRAWATAAGVQRPLPSGMIPSLTQRRSVAGGHVEPAGYVAEREIRHDPENESGGTAVVVPPHAGNAARCLGRRRSSEGDALRVTLRPPTSRPIAWSGCRT